MKKRNLLLLLLFTIVLIFVSNISIAQDTTKVNGSVIYNDVKSAINVNAPKIEKAITSLAQGLKVTADNVWNILVKQQKVWSICYLILTIAAIGNWLYFWKNNYIKYKPEDYYTTTQKVIGKITNPKYDEHDARHYPSRDTAKLLVEGDITETEIKLPLETIGCTIKNLKYLHLGMCIILSVLSFIHFETMLTGFINPEYGAMKTIATIAQNLK